MKIPLFSRRYIDRPAILDILILLFLTLGAFFTYRYGIAALPRADHVTFMEERQILQSDWDYFLRSLSLGRYDNIIFLGEPLLFRPLHHAIRVLLDIFFRPNLYVIGAVGIIIHALTCFSFYLFSSKLIGRFFGLLFSLIILTQYAGMDLVFWRHINPYMLGLLFFTVGFTLLLKLETSKTPQRLITWIVTLFFLSSLCHELLIYALPGCGILVMLISFIKKGQRYQVSALSTRNLFIICFLPTVLYVGLDLIDLAVVRPPSIFSHAHEVNRVTPFQTVSNMVYLAGLFSIAFLTPNRVTLTFPRYYYQAVWDFNSLPPRYIYGMGFALIFFLSAVFIYYLIKYVRRKNTAQATIAFIMISYLAATIGGIAAAKISFDSFSYMMTATYYYYISMFIILTLFVLLFSQLRGWVRGKLPVQKWVSLSVIPMIFFWQIPYNFVHVREVLKSRFNQDNAIANATLQVANIIHKNPRYCYGDSFDPLFSSLAPFFLLYREMCTDDQKEALYGVIAPDGNLWLLRRKIDEKRIIFHNIGKNQFIQKDSSLFSLSSIVSARSNLPLNEIHERIRKSSVVLSAQSFNPVNLSVQFQHVEAAGLIVAYHDPLNFAIFGIQPRRSYLYLVRNGDPLPGSFTKNCFWNKEFLTLAVTKVGKVWMVTMDQNIISTFHDSEFLEGKVGFYYVAKDGKVVSPTNIRVGESRPNEENVIWLDPAIQLKPLPKSVSH